MKEQPGYKVITAVGADRLGITDDFAEIVSRNRCNIEECKMAVLDGKFAVIMLVSGKPKDLHSLSEGIYQRGDNLGLQIFVKNTIGPTIPPCGIPYIPLSSDGTLSILKTWKRKPASLLEADLLFFTCVLEF